MIVLSASIVLALTFVFMGGCTIGAVNHEIELRTAIQAKSVANEATLDTMWKIIKQKAQISEQAVTSIKDMNSIYEELVNGRSGGAIFKMVSENYPNLGTSDITKMYSSVMASVEAERNVFKRDQQALVDLVRQHSSYVQKIPVRWLLAVFGENEKFVRRTPENSGENTYLFVTASQTNEMVNSGVEDDINLFQNKAEKE